MELAGIRDFGGLKYRFIEVHRKDEGAFREELLELNASQLINLGKFAEIEGEGKKELIDGIVGKVVEATGALPDMDIDNKPEPHPIPVKNGKEVQMKKPKKESLTTEMKTPKIYVDPELLKIMDRPSNDQYKNMKKSIKGKGLIDSIEIEEDGRLVDGHTRLKIMEELKIPIPPDKIKIVHIPPDKLFEYIVNKNFARRHLSDLQRVEYAARLYPEEFKRVEKEELSKKRSDSVKETIAAKKEDKPVEKGKKPKASAKKAELAKISQSQQEQYEFLKKYAPRLLEEENKLGEKAKIGHAYGQAKKWWDYLKAQAPEIFEKIRRGEAQLEESYVQVFAKKGEIVFLGPIAKALKDVEDKWLDLMAEKYGKDGDFDPIDKKFHIFLEARIKQATSKSA